MALSKLTNVATVAALPAGNSSTISHGIHVEGISHAPNIVMPDRPTTIRVASVSATQITFTNDGDVASTAIFYIALDHTVQKPHGDTTSTDRWFGGTVVDTGLLAPANIITLADTITDPITFNDRVKVSGNLTDYGTTPPVITLSAGWDATATAAASGNDQRMTIAITAAGTPGANPTAAVAFVDGTWTTAPYVVVCTGGDDETPTSTNIDTRWSVTSVSATGFTLTFNGTPVAGNVYTVHAIVIG